MSNALLFPGAMLTPGADGDYPSQDLAFQSRHELCVDEVEVSCSFLSTLPCGPLWDRAKVEVREAIVEAGGIPVGGFDTPTMVNYAVYGGQVRSDYVNEILAPVIRENDPCAAVDTLDDWIGRLGWIDCYRNACRTQYMANLSPYERTLPCGDGYCESTFPEEFERALKHAILRSLVRLQRAGPKNLVVMNWIIEPLGAELRLPTPLPDLVQDFVDGVTTYDVAPCFADLAKLELHSLGPELPGAPTAESFCGDAPPSVAAEQTYDCEGVATQVFPGLLAAECIIRSLTPQCPDVIIRMV